MTDLAELLWVEYYGGPEDGSMEELPRWIIGEEPGPKATEWITSSVRTWGDLPVAPGRYFARSWADQTLGIVRMHWEPGKAA